MATLGVDYSNVDDRGTLDRLRDAGVAMHAIVLAQSPVGGIRPREGFTQRTGRGVGQSSSQTDGTLPPSPTANHDSYQGDPLELDRFLLQGPTQTGGRRRNLHTLTSAEPAVNDLTAQLQNQYLVVYSRPGMLIPPREDPGRRRARGTRRPWNPGHHRFRPMTRRHSSLNLVVALIGGLTVATSGQTPTPSPQTRDQDAPQAPSFRTGVDVVSLNVTVTDGTAGFVTDLGQEDLLVYEDGVLQKITYFSRRQLPIALALLIDTSASMDERMETAQEAAIGFSRRLRPDDLAEIIDFDSRVDILQPFTNSVDELEDAIRQTSAGGSTSLYNALYISLKELKKAPLRVEDVRREAIVVLSDGEDTSSLVTFEEILDLAKRSETAIYSIGISTDDGGTGFREADFVLRQLAHETGGRAFFPDDVDDLAGIYEQISDELSSQYSVGYSLCQSSTGRAMASYCGASESREDRNPHEAGLLRADE